MTNSTDTNRVAAIQSIGEALAGADLTAEKAYLPVLLRMQEEDVSVDEIKKGGTYFDAFQAGILIGWQGAAFADEYVRVNGKAVLAGKVLNRATSRLHTVEKPKAAWQRDLSSKVSKLRDMYERFIEPEAEEAEEAASGNGAGQSGNGAGQSGNGAGQSGNGAGQSGPERTGLLGQVAKSCTAWVVRMQKVADGTSKHKPDMDIEGDMTELRTLLDKAAKLAIDLNK